MQTWKLAALSLATCLSANAALRNHDADRLEINIPNLRSGVIASITLGYMEPNSYSTGYVLVDGIGGVNPNGRTEDIEPCSALTYDFMAGWKFCDTGWDLRARIFHVDSANGNSFQRQSNPYLWTIVGNVDDPDYITLAESAEGKISYKVYAFDAQFSQHINIGSNVGMRLYWGASYHTLERDTQIGYRGQVGTLDAGNSEITQLKSDFGGYGPNVGMEMSYYLCHNIGIVGHIGGSMLFGSVNSRARTKVSLTAAEKTTSFRHKDRGIVVPQVDFTLGLDYSYQLCGGSVLRFELGYAIKHYFDSLNNITVIGGLSDATHNHGASHCSALESLSVHGAYLTFEGRA